jgi:hypothetical protein
MRSSLDPTAERALKLNLDDEVYGTFAEIGAGQEVARWFFAVGGAAGTVAKTMSAYDMTVSDAVYGKADRYVSRQRVEEMLDHDMDFSMKGSTPPGATAPGFSPSPTPPPPGRFAAAMSATPG